MRVKNFMACLIFCIGSMQMNAQQWFVKSWAVTPNNGAGCGGNRPLIDPVGSLRTQDNNIVLYGSVGVKGSGTNYCGALTGSQGLAEMILVKNDLNGNNIWSFALGSAEHDEITRVLEVQRDVFIIIGQQGEKGEDAFLTKVKVTNSGGTYQMDANLATYTKPNSYFYDLADLPLVQGNFIPSDPSYLGVGICGKELDDQKKPTGKPFVIRVNLDLDFNNSNSWLNYYKKTEGSENDLVLRSLISVDETAGNSDLIIYDTPGGSDNGTGTNPLSFSTASIALCGEAGGEIYLLKLDMQGNVIDDFGMQSSGAANAECESSFSFNASYDDFVDGTFSELIQLESGDIVAVGNSTGLASAITMLKINLDLDQPNWQSSIRMGGDNAHPTQAIELLKSDLGFMVVSSYYDQSNGKILQFNHFYEDGQFQGFSHDIKDPTGPMKSLYSTAYDYTTDDEPNNWKDLILECDNFIHYPGSGGQGGSFSNEWNEFNFFHVKSGFGLIKTCTEEIGSYEVQKAYCDDLNYFPIVNTITQPNGSFTIEGMSNFIVTNTSANFDIALDCVSDCEDDACVDQVELIQVCKNTSSIQEVLTVPGASAGDYFVWSNGYSGLGTGFSQITIDALGQYSCYVTDANGCLKVYKFIVVFAPDANIQITEHNITCNGQSNADICFTSSINIVQIMTAVTPVGGSPGFGITNIISPTTFGCLNALTTNFNFGVPGNYNIYLYDEFGCVYNYSFTFEEPAILDNITDYCTNDPNGGNDLITFSGVSGGTPDYIVELEDQPITGPSTTYTLCTFGLNSCSFTADPTHTYTFHVTDANGCTASKTLSYVSCTNKKGEDGHDAYIETVNEFDVSVFPNPTNGKLTIYCSAPYNDLLITDISGRQVRHLELSDYLDTYVLDLDDQAQGIYSIRLSHSDGTYSHTPVSVVK